MIKTSPAVMPCRVTLPGRHYSLKPLSRYMIEKGLLAGSLVAAGLLLAPLAEGAPVGGVVVEGQGSVTHEGSLTTHINQQSQNLLMNFDSFDVGKNESVLISQPNASAWFVGQILGGDPTRIYGSINANGQVALVNPHGVIFGQTATINAAGVFASGLAIDSKQIFKDGKADFKGEPGAGGYVVNRGVIDASVGGSVSLLGESVTNSGVIMATLGHVNLASGSRAVVNFGPDQLIGIQVTDPVLQNKLGLKSAVDNSGKIEADGGTVMLTSSVSKSIFDHAINNQGIIKAQSAEYKNGVIKLSGAGSSVLNTGTLDASSQGHSVAGGAISITSDSSTTLGGTSRITATSDSGKGGSIDVHGEDTAVSAGASLDVSGATAGGTIDVAAKSSVTIQKDARLTANATNSGDGGTITVSGNAVNVSGAMSVRGGPHGGDGGSVTLSARGTLTYDGSVDASAPQGKAGTLTLSAPGVTVDKRTGVTASALEQSQANIQIDATHNVTVNDLGGSHVDLLGNLGINVTGGGATFTMAGAHDILRTDGTVTIAVTGSGIKGEALIDIAGTIKSKPFPNPLPNNPLNPGNTVALTATDGRIRIRDSARLAAGDDEDDPGTILLTATGYDGENNAGTIMFSGSADASSGSGLGGTVKLLGDRVALMDHASIDASGALGGGEVLVGGNEHGQGPERNAVQTYVGSAVTISANALRQGSGGKVIVWSDEVTKFYGNIAARGGADGGNGGFVETSGKQMLVARGHVDASAPDGFAGTWLLDPKNVTIVTGTTATGTLITGTATATTTAFDPTHKNSAQILASDIVSALGSTNVLIHSGSDNTSNYAGDITVSAPITVGLSTSRTLTLDAAGSITVDAAITDTGTAPLNLVLTANSSNYDPASGIGAISIYSPIVTQGGSVTLNSGPGGVSLAAGDSITTTAAANTGLGSGAVDISVTGTGTVNLAGSIVATGAGNNAGAGSAGGAVNITTTAGAIAVGDIATSGGAGTTTGGSAGALALSAGTSVTNTITLNGSTLSTAGGAGTTTGTGTTVIFNEPVRVSAGPVSIDTGATGGNITFASTLDDTSAGGHTLSLTAGTGTVTFSGAVGSASALGGLTVNSAASTWFKGSVAAASLTTGISGTTELDGNVTTTNSQIYNDPVTLGGNVLLTTTGNGDIDFNSSIDAATAGGESLTLSAAGPGTVMFSGAVGGGTNGALGAVSISSANSVTESSGLTAASFMESAGGTGTTTLTGLVTTTGQVALANGRIGVAGGISAGGVVSLTAGSGAITGTGTIAGTTINLTAATGMGSSGQSASLQLSAPTVDATTTMSGGIYLNSVYGAPVNFNSIKTQGAGNVELRANGAATLTSVNAANGSVLANASGGNLSATSVTTNGSGNIDLTTTGTGNVFLGDVQATGQSVTVASSGSIDELAPTDPTADVTAGTIGLAAANGIGQAGAFQVTGSNLSLSGGTGGIALQSLATGPVILTSATANSSGIQISQSGGFALTVTSAQTTSSGSISITNAGGDLTADGIAAAGNVSLGTTSSGNVAIGTVSANWLTANSAGTLNLGAGTVNGVLSATSNNGAISQSGTITVAGTSSINAGTGSITLTASGNDFQGTVNLAGSTTQITDSNALALGSVASGALTIISHGSLDLGTGTVSGNLTASSNGGPVSEAVGGLSVSGTASVNAGANTITLDDTGNAFTGAVGLTTGSSAGNASLFNSGPTILAASTIGNNYSMSAKGTITQTGALTIAGTATFSTSNNDITLDNTGNVFTGSVTFNGLSTANLSVYDATALDLQSGLTVGNLTVSASGITQAGPLTVSGTATFDGGGTAGGTNDVTLSNTANDFGTVSIVRAGNVSLADANDVILGQSTVGGNYDVAANGNITQSGALNVSGVASFDAGGTTTGTHDITLDGTGNDFSTVTVIDGGNVYFTDANSISLGASTVGGLLSVAAHAIDVSGAVAAGSVGLDATSGVGNITESSGSLSIVGPTTLLAQAGDSITLNAAANNFDSNNSGDSVTVIGTVSSLNLRNGHNIKLGGASVTNALTVTAPGIDVAGAVTAGGMHLDATGGDITESGGPVTVTGTATFTVTGTHSLILGNANNDLNTVRLSAGTGTVTLADVNGFAFGPSTVSGALDISSKNINVDGALTAGSLSLGTTSSGTVTVNAPITTTSGDLTFTSAASVKIAANLTSAGAILANNIGNLILDPVVLTSNGDINLDGSGTVTSATIEGSGLVDLEALGDGAIILPNLSDAGDGLATNLRLAAQGGVTVKSIDLKDGTSTDGVLTVVVDSNNNQVASFTANGNLSNAAGISISGSAAKDDSATINGTLSTSNNNILFDSLKAVTLNGNLNSAGGIAANVVGTVNLVAGKKYVANGGTLDFSQVGLVSISGTGNVSLTTTNNHDVRLANVVDAVDGATTNLMIDSAGSVDLASVNLHDGTFNDGSLNVTIDSNGGGGNAFVSSGTSTNLASFTLTAGGSNDTAQFDGSVTAGGGIAMNNFANVNLADGVNLTGASIDAGSVAKLTLTGTTINLLTATGGGITLGNVDSAYSELRLDAGTSGAINVASYTHNGGLGGDLRILNSSSTTFAGTVSAGVVVLANTTGDIAFDGTTTIGSLTTSNSGAYRLLFVGPVTTVNTASFNNAGGLVLSGTLKSPGTALSLADVRLQGNATIDTTNSGVKPAGAALTVGGVIDSTTTTPHTLTLNAGSSGPITVSGAVDHIGAITIADSGGTTFQSAVGLSSPGSFTVSNTRAGQEVAFQSAVHFTDFTTQAGAYAVSFTGANNVIDNAVNFLNTGGLTLSNKILFDGGASTPSTETVNVAGSISTSGDKLSLGNLVLSDVTNIDTTNAGANPSGGNIQLASVSGGGTTLSLNSGTGGAITVAGAVNDVSSLTIDNSDGVSFDGTVGAVTPGAVTIANTTAGAGIGFNASTHITTLTTSANNYDVSFVGASNIIDNPVTFLNSGTLTFGNGASDSIQFSGGVDVGSAATVIGGVVSTIGAPLTLGQVTIADGRSAKLSTAGGDVNLSQVQGTDNGANDAGIESLTIDAGVGAISVGNIAGATNALTNVAVTSGSNVNYGTVTLPGTLNQSGVTGATQFGGTVSLASANLSGTTFTVNGGMTSSGSIQVTNSGAFRINNMPVTADNGFSTSGSVVLSAGINTVGANVAIGGNLTIADNQDVGISTGGGNFSVSGTTSGTNAGATDAGDESLTINAGAGKVDFSSIAGAGTNGLTKVTLTASDGATFGDITMAAGSLVQTNRATGSTVFNGNVNLASANLKGTNFILGNFTTSGPLDIDASNTISQAVGTTLAPTGLMSLVASDVNLPALAAQGGVNLLVSGNVSLDNNQALDLSGSVGGTLTASASGAIGILPSSSLSLGGDASFTGSSLSLDNLSASGNVNLGITNAATLTSTQSISLEGSAGSLSVTATNGTIAGSGNLSVAGVADFSASGSNGAISLTSPGNAFGSLRLNSPSGAATVTEANNTQLDAVDAAALTLTSGGNVTGGANGDIAVSGLANISASGDITLSPTSGHKVAMGEMKATGGAIAVDETSADGLALAGITAGSLDLTTTGPISAITNASLSVAGDTTLHAGGGSSDIQLAQSANSFGNLDLQGANVNIVESGPSVISNLTAQTLNLKSSGDISELPSATITVTGPSSWAAGSTSANGRHDINLLAGNNSLGTFSVIAKNLNIALIGPASLGKIDATNAAISSNGDVTGTDLITVPGTLTVDAGSGSSGVDLGNSGNAIGQLSVNAGNVTVQDSSNLVLDSVQANNLVLDVSGSVTDGAGSIAATSANITATGDITLGVPGSSSPNDLVQFGNLSLNGGVVNVTQSGDIALGKVVAGSLTLTSDSGNISTASSSSNLNVTGSTSFTTNASTGVIDLLNGTNQFGNLSLSGRTADVREADGVSLGPVNVSSLKLISAADITDTANAVITVLADANLTANGNVTLGDGGAGSGNQVNLGSLNVTAANVNVTESGSMNIAGLNITGNATLNAQTSMAEGASAVINVGKRATLNVGGSTQNLALDGNNNRFGSLDLTGDNITLNLAAGTTLADVTAQKLSVNVAGDLTVGESGNRSVRVTNQANLDANNVLFAQGSQNNFAGLNVTTSNAGSVQIESSINPSLNSTGVDSTNPGGNIIIDSPTVSIGVAGATTAIATVGSSTGGSISIAGVTASGASAPSQGAIKLIGKVTMDTTNNVSGGHGADINLVYGANGSGTISAEDPSVPTSLWLTAGTAGQVYVGNFLPGSRINAFHVVNSAQITMNDVYAAGSTIDLNSYGDITGSGPVDNTIGNITMNAVGAIDLQKSVSAGQGTISLTSTKSTITASALTAGSDLAVSGSGDVTLGGVTTVGGNATLKSSAGGIQTTGALTAAGDVNVGSSNAMILGSNVTSSKGAVTLTSSNSTIDSSGDISGASNVGVAASGDVTLANTAGGAALSSNGGATVLSMKGDVNFNGNASAAGNFNVMSRDGQISQQMNTTLTAGGNLSLSALSGINIASLKANGDVTLVITQSSPNANGSVPLFKRVNAQPTNPNANPDIKSVGGTISFVAPQADVGTANDPFVQRAESPNGGIFYGLANGTEYSVDIGNSLPLYTMPPSLTGDIGDIVGQSVLSLGQNVDLSFNNNFALNYQNSLAISLNSTAKQGQTAAQASSRATAASGRNEEEEVSSVNATAFQNLKNYDENPNGILLPADQRYAYDDSGNTYLMMTMRTMDERSIPVLLYLLDPKMHRDAPTAGASEPATAQDKKERRTPIRLLKSLTRPGRS